MTEVRKQVREYIQKNRDEYLKVLSEFVRIPSISTDPDHEGDIRTCAEWVAEKLRAVGMERVEIMETKGHPVVFAEITKAGPEAITVLIYGHYDVQPPDPVDLWETGAFEPTQRGENLYGRGASDMKGQVLATLNAVEAIMQFSDLPVNIKFLIEGEEEIGSPNLGEFIANNKELLACDFCVNPDAGMIAPDLPTITYALRGLAYFEIRVSGADRDLHSGVFGGVIHNPAQALCELISGMHDEYGRITLPGFYDEVRELDQAERNELARLPLDAEFYRQQTGADVLWGESEYTPNERVGARPTLEVNGFLSGFTGEGAKTVLPAKAMAKISTRLVPNQKPEEVHRALLTYLEKNAPKTIRWEVIDMGGCPASITDRENRGAQALAQAMETVWGKRPVFKREGGSVPVVGDLQDILGIDSVLTGFGLPDDNLHAPNEKIHLPTWYRGIEAMAEFILNLGV